ncbi:hypothetical protein DFP72DRAFT_986157 [Ephemerocybe angulata]|uniref:Uncharacterized protein n=1 Tax=Ephemerocybe angulata TaxID=980116 RepID=A0A8H6MDC0_9AGAR|nr:hypothetical protein DFP72DRAFT_986157 [Tulosesus angulatus]
MQEVFARMSEPRPDTPEPSSRQGRRNGSSSGVQLLDNEGGVTAELEACLKHIFAKYCTPSGKRELSSSTSSNRRTKDELIEFLDVTDEGCLTCFKGFLQIYQLQTENDEEETWRDLSSHGFDRSLQLVYTRREDADTEDMDMDQATSS